MKQKLYKKLQAHDVGRVVEELNRARDYTLKSCSYNSKDDEICVFMELDESRDKLVDEERKKFLYKKTKVGDMWLMDQELNNAKDYHTVLTFIREKTDEICVLMEMKKMEN